MKVTVLMENTSPECLLHEHGLSLHLSYEGHSVLLDAGSSGRFTENAAALGVDLAAVEKAALSHGHWDHADGLAAFFACNAAAPVYARPAALLPQVPGEGRQLRRGEPRPHRAVPASLRPGRRTPGPAARPAPHPRRGGARAVPGGRDGQGPGGHELLLPRRGRVYCKGYPVPLPRRAGVRHSGRVPPDGQRRQPPPWGWPPALSATWPTGSPTSWVWHRCTPATAPAARLCPAPGGAGGKTDLSPDRPDPGILNRPICRRGRDGTSASAAAVFFPSPPVLSNLSSICFPCSQIFSVHKSFTTTY